MDADSGGELMHSPAQGMFIVTGLTQTSRLARVGTADSMMGARALCRPGGFFTDYFIDEYELRGSTRVEAPSRSGS